MPPSEAYRMASGSPFARTSSSCLRMSAEVMPCRRWVGFTATPVTPAARTEPPGTGSGNEAPVDLGYHPFALDVFGPCVATETRGERIDVGRVFLGRDGPDLDIHGVLSLRAREPLEHVGQHRISRLGPRLDERLPAEHLGPQ